MGIALFIMASPIFIEIRPHGLLHVQHRRLSPPPPGARSSLGTIPFLPFLLSHHLYSEAFKNPIVVSIFILPLHLKPKPPPPHRHRLPSALPVVPSSSSSTISSPHRRCPPPDPALDSLYLSSSSALPSSSSPPPSQRPPLPRSCPPGCPGPQPHPPPSCPQAPDDLIRLLGLLHANPPPGPTGTRTAASTYPPPLHHLLCSISSFACTTDTTP